MIRSYTSIARRGFPFGRIHHRAFTTSISLRNQDLNVGEIEGGTFRIEPLRRVGEDAPTMRARLLYQSRKRGTRESELLLSTFAHAALEHMTPVQMAQYDRFLDENDWDIYYWATQEAPEASEGATTSSTSAASSAAPASADLVDRRVGEPRPGEWAQTVGTFKPAYRPVPERWRESEVLRLLRAHVSEFSEKDGLAFMPSLKPLAA